MSQISLPVRILLVGAVVFMAAWFTVLKPKEPEVSVTATPAVPAAPTAPAGPQSAPGKFADKAKAGAAQAEADAAGAANAGIEEDGATATSTAPGAATSGTATRATTALAPPPLSPESLKGLPAPLRAGLEDRKVVVLGVLNTEATPWAAMADDDRAVRTVLRGVNRYGGAVVVRTAPLRRLARYDGLLKALDVTQSPTVVVIDRGRRAVALEGYVDRRTVNQAIADARDTSIARRVKDPYLRSVNELCGSRNLLLARAARWETVRGGYRRLLRSHLTKATRVRARFVGISTPARWRGLDRRVRRYLDADVAAVRRTIAAARRGGRSAAARQSRRNSFELAALASGLDRRFNRVGLTACARNRTR